MSIFKKTKPQSIEEQVLEQLMISNELLCDIRERNTQIRNLFGQFVELLMREAQERNASSVDTSTLQTTGKSNPTSTTC
jgi:hypothetical protein